MAPKKKKNKKESVKEPEPVKKSLAALDLPPQRVIEEEAVEEILERLPKIILDHNICRFYIPVFYNSISIHPLRKFTAIFRS